MLRSKTKKQTPLQKLKMEQIGVRVKPKRPKMSRDIQERTLGQLDNRTAWEAYSRYIRIRDAEWRGDGWYGKCISCSHNGRVAWIDAKGHIRFDAGWDAGHYVRRGAKVVKYDDRNVNLQCKYHCNKMLSGNPGPYRLALMDKYGVEVPDELEKLAKDHPTYKFSRQELIEITRDAKEFVSYTLAHPMGL